MKNKLKKHVSYLLVFALCICMFIFPVSSDEEPTACTHSLCVILEENADGHILKCESCGTTISEKHEYSSKSICTVCGYKCLHPDMEYEFKDEWRHTVKCASCGYEKVDYHFSTGEVLDPHSPAPSNICAKCGFECEHTHTSFQIIDESYHFEFCSCCKTVIDEKQEHDFSNHQYDEPGYSNGFCSCGCSLLEIQNYGDGYVEYKPESFGIVEFKVYNSQWIFGMKVDGEKLGKAKYTVLDENTIRINNDYLDTLSPGKHSLYLYGDCSGYTREVTLMILPEKFERTDINHDCKINTEDAVYLLRNIMRPSKYPTTENRDINGDGKINTEDAIYLLRHIMRPEKYPLAD